MQTYCIEKEDSQFKALKENRYSWNRESQQDHDAREDTEVDRASLAEVIGLVMSFDLYFETKWEL